MGNVWDAHQRQKIKLLRFFFNSFFNLGYNFLIIFSTFFAENSFQRSLIFSSMELEQGAADPVAHVIFGPKCPICCKQKYFEKAIYRILIYLLVIFIEQHSKKSLQQVQRNRRNSDTSILEPKWTICPKYEYLWKIY